MALSNSTNYTIDRDTLIRSAYELCHVAVEGESITANQVTVAARTLNIMIKAWVAHGLQVWKRKTHTLSLVDGQKKYILGTPLAIACTMAGSGTAATVTITQHGYKTGDSITIADATDTDYNGTFTITVTSENVFTYTAGGTLNATDSGNATLASAGSVIRPERLLEVNRVNSGNNRVPMTQLTRNEYEFLPNKESTGTPIDFHYERKLGAGSFYLWPTADSAAVTEYTIEIVYQSPMDDMDAATDNFDFPAEWLEAITYGLAERLAPRFGLPMDELSFLKSDAKAALELALDYDFEEGSVYFQAERQ